MDPDANAYGFGSLPAQLCGSPAVPPCADPRFAGVTNITSAGVSTYNGMVVYFSEASHPLGFRNVSGELHLRPRPR